MEITDVNGNLRKWKAIRKKEFKDKKVVGMSKHNSELLIDLLSDFENGINTTTKGKRTEGSLLRIRQAFRLLNEEAKNKPLEKLTQKQLSNICDKKNSEDFVKNIKVIYNWIYRTERIEKNIAEHLVANDYSKGKPVWVFLSEENMKTLINSANANYRALICFLYDSGLRPQEAWKIRIFDFQDNFTILHIPKKRKNGERVSKTFERKIKLKLSSGLIKDYVKINNLKNEDLLFQITQAGFNKTLRSLCKKLFGIKKTKAGESPDKITATDIRHIATLFWLIRYKKNLDLMYRMGWMKENKIFYYSEFLNLRDTITDADMITSEDKTQMEIRIKDLEKQNKEIMGMLIKDMDEGATKIDIQTKEKDLTEIAKLMIKK